MDNSGGLLGKQVWVPSDTASTSMEEFRRVINKKFSLHLANYHELWEWSCANLNDFWCSVWDHTGIVSSLKSAKALPSDDVPIYPPPKWFEGSRLNFAENLLRYASSSPTRTAVVQSTEVDTSTGELDEKSVTYQELYSLTAKVAHAMRKRGIKPNDCIASYSSNNVENLITFLAASSIGAVWTSAAADFGPEGVLERLRTVRPKLLLSVNAVRYNGKVHDHVAKLKSVVEGLEEDRKEDEQRLEAVVVVPYVRSHGMPDSADGGDSIWTTWDAFLSEGSQAKTIDFEQLEFNHPLWILFSSGTTGKPKAITHRAGGMLIQLSKEHLIHGGLCPQDVFFQHTTTGWMMWNFLIAGLVSGCTIVLYDGSPLKPASVLWDLAERHGVTTFGTSAAYLGALEKTGYKVQQHHPNLKVKQILSTGSPLRAELYPYILDNIGSDILIGSVTGGTDLCSLFAGHNVALPVYAGEIQARNLGMDIAVYDSSTLTEFSSPGTVGDLVCKKPFPAQPLGFWKQPESKYRDSYYAQIPGVWYHGDFVQLSPHGGLVMLGRSDGILNPGGIRFGSSEIYETLESPENPFAPQIADSLVVALKTPSGDDEVVCLFIVPTSSSLLETESDPEWTQLVAHLTTLIRTKRSARHVPKYINRVGDIPKTLNGKKVEIPVKKLINGAPLDTINKATLLNPESLQQFVDLGKELRSRLASEYNSKK